MYNRQQPGEQVGVHPSLDDHYFVFVFVFDMYLHLPVAGQEREAEGDRSSGDEDAVEDRQHCQDLSKCQLWNKDMILLIVMLLLMMMITFYILSLGIML